MIARTTLALAAAIAIAAQVVRSAIVDGYAETSPDVAHRVWPNHPDSQLWLGLTEIGRASHDRRPVDPKTFQEITAAALKSPLAPEPYVVRGIQAQLQGDESRALDAFLAAKLRDGRSIPARYFLADHYFRAGDAVRGLSEVSILAQVTPTGNSSLAPYVASFARDPANWPKLRGLFQSNAALKDATLSTLAGDPRNADLVLRLGGPIARGQTPNWAGVLLVTLVSAGNYDKAKDIWDRLARPVPTGRSLIFDSGFAGSDAPPPFNWTLASSTLGLAERQRGRLHVVYYGQEEGALASQLLLLKPGAYRLSFDISGDRAHAGSISWVLSCAGSKDALATISLADSSAARGKTFTVPGNCPAQQLELRGSAQDLPQQVDLTVSNLRLVAEDGHG